MRLQLLQPLNLLELQTWLDVRERPLSAKMGTCSRWPVGTKAGRGQLSGYRRVAFKVTVAWVTTGECLCLFSRLL